MFMNQISVFESKEITTFGFFNINLSLVISVSIYLLHRLVIKLFEVSHPSPELPHNSISRSLLT